LLPPTILLPEAAFFILPQLAVRERAPPESNLARAEVLERIDSRSGELPDAIGDIPVDGDRRAGWGTLKLGGVPPAAGSQSQRGEDSRYNPWR